MITKGLLKVDRGIESNLELFFHVIMILSLKSFNIEITTSVRNILLLTDNFQLNLDFRCGGRRC